MEEESPNWPIRGIHVGTPSSPAPSHSSWLSCSQVQNGSTLGWQGPQEVVKEHPWLKHRATDGSTGEEGRLSSHEAQSSEDAIMGSARLGRAQG